MVSDACGQGIRALEKDSQRGARVSVARSQQHKVVRGEECSGGAALSFALPLPYASNSGVAKG